MSSDRSVLTEVEQKVISAEIKELLKDTSQVALGDQIKMSQSAISAAKRGVAGPRMAKAIERHLGLSLPELLKKHANIEQEAADIPKELEVAIAFIGDRVGQEAVRRVVGRAAGARRRPEEWYEELRHEGHVVLDELHEPIAPASALRSVKK